MDSRKRERSQASGEPYGEAGEGPGEVPFTLVIWSEISTVLFSRLMTLVLDALSRIIRERGGSAAREKILVRLRSDMHLTWRAGQTFLVPSEAAKFEALVSDGINRLIAHIFQITCATDDPLALCKHYLRIAEECGFVEEDGGVLGECLAQLKYSVYPNGYAYSERDPCAGISVLSPTQPGERKGGAEATEITSSRVGFNVVVAASPSLHPAVNTSIQLMEPRKRRPPLDEYRIFSHPKKSATHGVEDVMVDEELYCRALHALCHHLDTHGSLVGLSPFARFTLYNTVLDKDFNGFYTLLTTRCVDEEKKKSLQALRELIESKKESLAKTRFGLREAAQRVGWFAVSAQWRDQILHTLQEAEEADWYGLGEVLKSGKALIFPNYALSLCVKQLMLGVLKKLAVGPRSPQPSEAHRTNDSMIIKVVEDILLPLLSGETPSWPADDRFEESVKATAKARRKMNHLYTKFVESRRRRKCPVEVAVSLDTSRDEPQEASLLILSMIHAIQCAAEMLELCAGALDAADGIVAFSKRFLAAEWEGEEEIIEFLLKKDANNVAIAALAGIPKVYKDLVSSTQVVLADVTLLPIVVAAKQFDSEQAAATVGEDDRVYVYWKILSSLLESEERHDDVVLLRVQRCRSHPEPEPEDERLHLESSLERIVKVWPQDMAALLAEEDKLRVTQEAESSSTISLEHA